MKKKMTLEKHQQVANHMAIIAHSLNEIHSICEKHFAYSSKLMKALWKLLPTVTSNQFANLQHELDEEYHKLATDDDFKELGHIGYSLDQRYEKLKEAQRY